MARRTLRYRLLGALTLLVPVLLLTHLLVAAAPPPAFADPAFQTTWNQGEARSPNFWGNAVSLGLMEPYNDASRLVQYFDKGRMEKQADGSITAGLLATELLTGKLQLGDAKFASRPLAAIPIAGDPDNPGPTYAEIGANAMLLMMTASTPGAAVTRQVSGTGQVGSTSVGGSDPQAQVGGYDQVTQHNVVAGFGAYREKVGVGTIGYAITEPFWVQVKVGGMAKEVLVQGYERRVLTYTPGNSAGNQVEMGNIGQHYFKWRTTPVPATAIATVPTSMPAASTVATTVPTPGMVSGTVALPTNPSGTPYPTAKPGVTHKPGAICKAGTNGTVVVCTPT